MMSNAADKAYDQIVATYPQIARNAEAYAKAYTAGDLNKCGRIMQGTYDTIDNLYDNIRTVIDDTNMNHKPGES